MSSAPVLHSLDERGVATVTLNRPEVGNAYNGDLIQPESCEADSAGEWASISESWAREAMTDDPLIARVAGRQLLASDR